MSSSAPPAKRPLTCANGTIFIGYVVQVGIHMLSDLFALFRHPDLGVLICSDCLLKYNQDDWTNYPATGDFFSVVFKKKHCLSYLVQRDKAINISI